MAAPPDHRRKIPRARTGFADVDLIEWDIVPRKPVNDQWQRLRVDLPDQACVITRPLSREEIVDSFGE